MSNVPIFAPTMESGSMWNWMLIMLFGTGSVITAAPVNVTTGETFFRAAKALTPVTDAMRVGIELGKATDEKKKAILTEALKLSDIGDLRVEVCKSEVECVTMNYSGPYFFNDTYGIGFDAIGSQLKRASFVGVRVRVDRPLNGIVIGWSNFVQ